MESLKLLFVSIVGAAAISLMSTSAFGFTILTFVSDACHENIMLGSIGVGPFSEEPSAEVNGIYAQYLEDIRNRGVPGDKPTRAFVRDVAQLYNLESRTLEEQYLLASFICGVRLPDTAGLNVVRINDVRFTHLDDDNQSSHSLRRSDHEHEQGDARSIVRSRDSIVKDLVQAQASYDSSAGPFVESRWNFDFAGVHPIEAYGPALLIGQAAHTIQDAYTHVLRDEEMRVVAIANFSKALSSDYVEERDGPRHSDRLDKCDLSVDFDRMRVEAARGATHDLMRDLAVASDGNDEVAPQTFSATLDKVYTLREGCWARNDYCDSPWLPVANEQLTEPFKIRPSCASGGFQSRLLPGLMWMVLLGVALVFRRRSL